MKKFLALLLAAMMLLGCTAIAEEATETGLTKDIVILFTSDVHAGMDLDWGFAGLAAVRDNLAKTNHVVLVDDGDAIQGETIATLTNGEAIVDLMNAVGYDVITIGNHEFDYGMEKFLALAEKQNAPYVSSNFTYNDELVFDPYAIKEFDGVKIAFVGVTTPRTFTSSTPTYFQDEEGNYVYGFCQDATGEKLYAAVQSAVDAARAEGAQYVVVMGHIGIEPDCSPWTSGEIINNTTGIDFFLDGHAHETEPTDEVKNKDGETVLRAACGTKLANIGWARIAVNGAKSTGLFKWESDLSAPALLGLDGAVADAVAEKAASIEEIRKTVVAKTAVKLITHSPDNPEVRLIRTVETNLGDLCADAYRALGSADIGMANGGGIRAEIDVGDITLANIYDVFPYSNVLCVVEATGQQILDALELGARNYPDQSGGFQQVSGLTYEIHAYVPSGVKVDEEGAFISVDGDYRVKNVMVGGEPLDLEKTYTLASHNYMIKNGGDGFNMFKGNNLVLDETLIDNLVLINYITDNLGGVVGEEYADVYGQGRITVVTEAP